MNSPDNYAVMGYPIHHSKSPRIHALFAEETEQNMSYLAQEVRPETFTVAVNAFFEKGGKGLNCTLPLKELAWEFATHKTPRAQAAKAVNTLILQANGQILGDNTDGIGLVADLKNNHGVHLESKRLLILGAGGATRGILLPLLDEKPKSITIANRTVEKALQLVKEFKQNIHACGFDALENHQFDIILNATSASLSDDLPPLPENILAENGICYDLAYSNQPTAFVRWGIEQNAHKSIDGLGMLVEQAAEAFFLWRGVRPSTQDVIDLLNAHR